MEKQREIRPCPHHTGILEYRLHSFFISDVNEGEWLTGLSGHLIPGKRALVLFMQNAGWAPDLIWAY
jgi:hypothetical protein